MTNRTEGRLIAPNFGLYRLKTFLEDNGYADVDVFNPEVYANSPIAMRELVRLITENEYHVIGFSPSHSNLISDLETAWMLKKIMTLKGGDRQPLFIAGGNEATHDTEKLLRNGPFDAACRAMTLTFRAEAALRGTGDDGDRG